MDLTELLNKTLELLNVKNANEITEKLFDVVKDNRNDIYEKFSELVSNDLSKDWLQQIYQYYLADRKEKKQDIHYMAREFMFDYSCGCLVCMV